MALNFLWLFFGGFCLRGKTCISLKLIFPPSLSISITYIQEVCIDCVPIKCMLYFAENKL